MISRELQKVCGFFFAPLKVGAPRQIQPARGWDRPRQARSPAPLRCVNRSLGFRRPIDRGNVLTLNNAIQDFQSRITQPSFSMSQTRINRFGCRCPSCEQAIRNQRTFGNADQPVICVHCEASLREVAPLSFLRPLLAWAMVIGAAITWPVALLTGFWTESALLFAALGPVIWLLTQVTHYERVLPPTKCLNCSYDLRASAVSHSDACPECGHHIARDQQLLIETKYLQPASPSHEGAAQTHNGA